MVDDFLMSISERIIRQKIPICRIPRDLFLGRSQIVSELLSLRWSSGASHNLCPTSNIADFTSALPV
jgi:hypothetical protein